MHTLGINAAYHDSAACLVRDGHIVAAAEEERFTRIKHAKRPVPFSTYELPYHAIDYCLSEARISLVDLDHVAYAYDPHIILQGVTGAEPLTLSLEPSAEPPRNGWEHPWEPLFISYIVNAPRHLADGVPHHLEQRFRGARIDGPYRWHFVEHHLAHAASAFHASPFARAAVLALDGRGERATTTYWRGEGTALERLGEVRMPHSLGLLYEEVTRYLGFLSSSDEYKVMALASFGQPRYRTVFERIVSVGTNGQYTIGPHDLETQFGPPRRRGEPFAELHYDIARSLQVVLEDAVLQLVFWLYGEAGEERLCLAGGVALNCVMNARLRDFGPFSELWVQPAAGDAGTALGAAMWIDAMERGDATRRASMTHAFLGPATGDDDIGEMLRWAGVPHCPVRAVAGETARLLCENKIVGWYQGRMEFGPRALGARSILASPLDAGMQARLNSIKDREDFRPVAPVVLEERAADWFEGAHPSPFMLFVFPIKRNRADRIPAVQHVDGTARIQTVNRAQHPLLYDVLCAVEAKTGVPVLVNTSFNSRGQPIVCSPRDALECFWSTPLDALVMGSWLLEKRHGD
jgi:carbamoyltransferase